MHRGWARLLLDRTRDFIIHGPAHPNGRADQSDQDDTFLLNHPERGGDFAAT